MAITLTQALPIAAMGEAWNLVGRGERAERQRDRQMRFQMERARLDQQNQQFQQSLMANMMGRQQNMAAQNARALFNAEQQRMRQQQGFMNSQMLEAQRNQGYRDNMEFLNSQRANQQIDYLNLRDSGELEQARMALSGSADGFNQQGQQLHRSLNQMLERIEQDPSQDAAGKEQARMKVYRRAMPLQSQRYAKPPEKPPWEFLAPEYDSQSNPTAFHPVHNPDGALGTAGVMVRDPASGKVTTSQLGHRWTGYRRVNPKTGVEEQVTSNGEWKVVNPDEAKAIQTERKEKIAAYKDAIASLKSKFQGMENPPRITNEMIEKEIEERNQMLGFEPTDEEVIEQYEEDFNSAVGTPDAPGTEAFVGAFRQAMEHAKQHDEWRRVQLLQYAAKNVGNATGALKVALQEVLDEAAQRPGPPGAGTGLPTQPLPLQGTQLGSEPIYTSPQQVFASPKWKAAKPGERLSFRIVLPDGKEAVVTKVKQ